MLDPISKLPSLIKNHQNGRDIAAPQKGKRCEELGTFAQQTTQRRDSPKKVRAESG
jgi:hypothetical protein